jgi:hypothetical protein
VPGYGEVWRVYNLILDPHGGVSNQIPGKHINYGILKSS